MVWYAMATSCIRLPFRDIVHAHCSPCIIHDARDAVTVVLGVIACHVSRATHTHPHTWQAYPARVHVPLHHAAPRRHRDSTCSDPLLLSLPCMRVCGSVNPVIYECIATVSHDLVRPLPLVLDHQLCVAV